MWKDRQELILMHDTYLKTVCELDRAVASDAFIAGENNGLRRIARAILDIEAGLMEHDPRFRWDVIQMAKEVLSVVTQLER